MRVHVKKPIWIAVLVVCVGAAPKVATGQNLHNMVESDGRAFPQVTGGIIAMRESADGRYYILANPGHELRVFDAKGNAVGQIPGAGSSITQFEYATDFDLASNGNIVVADRGANTIYTFAPDGSLKAKASVFAPTSVVALSNGQIAVTTLRTEHPIEIFEANGGYVRGFGEPHEISNPSPDDADAAPPPALADTGRIFGDSADNLYFGMLSPTDPEVKKFDRFGYAAFAANVPFDTDLPATQDSRVELGFNFTRLTASSQFNTWTTLGDTGAVHFGASAGSGLASMLANRDATGAGSTAGTITAETSLAAPTFGIQGGPGTGTGGSGGFGFGSGSSPRGSAPASGNSAMLNYFAPGTFSGSNLGDNKADVGLRDPTSVTPTSLDYLNGTPRLGPVSGAGVGGFSSYAMAALGPQPGAVAHSLIPPNTLPKGAFGRPQGGASGPLGATQPPSPLQQVLQQAAQHGSTLGLSGAEASNILNGTGSDTKAPTLTRFGSTDLAFVGSLRINLDKPRPPTITSKKLTAVGVDRQTQEFWAAIGPELVHFDKYGTPMGTYYMTTPSGAALQISAIVVEPDRLLIGSNPGGVYAFARPDKMAAVHSAQAGAKAENAPHNR
jgi:hypothetical protein